MARVATMDTLFLGAVLNRSDRRRMRLYGQMPVMPMPLPARPQPEAVGR